MFNIHSAFRFVADSVSVLVSNTTKKVGSGIQLELALLKNCAL